MPRVQQSGDWYPGKRDKSYRYNFDKIFKQGDYIEVDKCKCDICTCTDYKAYQGEVKVIRGNIKHEAEQVLLKKGEIS